MKRKNELFNLLNEFFDHIYLISLKKSIDRHDRIKQVLDGLDYEMFWGVDGSKLDRTEIEKQGLYDSELTKTKIPFDRELTSGEIGCTLSHLSVHKDVLDNGYEKALILEDDIAVAPDATEELMDSFSELPENWEVFYLGYLYNNNEITLPIWLRIYLAYPLLNLLGFQNYDAEKLRCKFPRPFSKNLELAGYHYGTHAYAVTPSGAQKIVEYQTPVTYSTDNAIAMMSMEETIKAFRVKKRVFYQNRNLPTTIEGRYKEKPEDY